MSNRTRTLSPIILFLLLSAFTVQATASSDEPSSTPCDTAALSIEGVKLAERFLRFVEERQFDSCAALMDSAYTHDFGTSCLTILKRSFDWASLVGKPLPDRKLKSASISRSPCQIHFSYRANDKADQIVWVSKTGDCYRVILYDEEGTNFKTE